MVVDAGLLISAATHGSGYVKSSSEGHSAAGAPVRLSMAAQLRSNRRDSRLKEMLDVIAVIMSHPCLRSALQ